MGFNRVRDGMRPCIECGLTLAVAEFSAYPYITRQGKPSVRYDSRCRPCSRERIQRRRADPAKREQDRAASLDWKRANRDAVAALIRDKRKTDPSFRASKAAYQRARKARMRAGLGRGRNEPEILAIYAEAKAAEAKLAACVECDDPLEMTMHVDHIVPLARGGKHVLANLRIVSARENLQKGARCA